MASKLGSAMSRLTQSRKSCQEDLLRSKSELSLSSQNSTFRPKINSNSRQLDAKIQSSGSRFEKLYCDKIRSNLLDRSKQK